MPISTVNPTTGLQSGYAGNISRNHNLTLKSPKVVDAASANIPFGAPVFITSTDTVKDISTVTPSMSNFAGLAVNEVKQGQVQGGTQNGYYKALDVLDLGKAGTYTVKCGRGTPAPTAGVYIRTALNVSYPNSLVGDWEAASDGSNSFQVTNASWDSARKDANGMTDLNLNFPAR